MDAQSRQTVRETVTSLPLIERQHETARIIDGDESIILWSELQIHESAIPEHIKVQVGFVLEEVLEHFNTSPDGKRLIITELELKGALSRMAIRAAAQGLFDVGEVLHESQQLQHLLFDTPQESE